MGLANLLDRRFDRLAVIGRASNSPGGTARWMCRCDCGKEVVVLGTHLRSGHTHSCGCFRRDVYAEKFNQTTHGMRQSPTYSSWKAMIWRTCTAKAKRFEGYRLVGVTRLWRESFATFLADMGERPPSTTLDRIDNRFGYFLANCRWATPTGQALNRRRRAA